MKKILAFVLVLMLVLSTSMVAFAEITSNSGSENGKVEVKIENNDEDRDDEDPSDVDPSEAIYKVTIDIANAVFTYTINDLDSYDSSTHAYTDGQWDATTGKDIKVTNDSNTSISVTAAFTEAGPTRYGVTAQLSNTNFDLDSAASVDATTEGKIGVGIDGKAPTVAEGYDLAFVTVTIAGK